MYNILNKNKGQRRHLRCMWNGMDSMALQTSNVEKAKPLQVLLLWQALAAWVASPQQWKLVGTVKGILLQTTSVMGTFLVP